MTSIKQNMNCPICKLEEKVQAILSSSGDKVTIDCPRCGPFTLTDKAIAMLQDKEPNVWLSAWIREKKEYGKAPPMIDSYSLRDIPSYLPSYSPSQKQLILLRRIERKTEYPGYGVDLISEFDFTLAWAQREEELIYIVNALTQRGLLDRRDKENGDLIITVTISPDGWDYLDLQTVNPSFSDQVFIAMSFSRELSEIYRNGIKPAVERAGYKPYRVDIEPHADRIDAKIITEIKNSLFMIADVTEQKQGVYFEAGFALGIRRPVIWCVREDELAKVHFDTRQYNHVVWKDENDLKDNLYYFISAIIGTQKNEA
jgi:nucleoside 2-deoxyribosyltransferase